MQEIIKSEKEILVAEINATVILHLQTERCQGGSLPEIEATGNLAIASAYTLIDSILVLGIVIIINKEESVTPFVSVETLNGCSEMTTILSKIVKGLEVGLCCNHLAESKSGKNSRKENGFFHLY